MKICYEKIMMSYLDCYRYYLKISCDIYSLKFLETNETVMQTHKPYQTKTVKDVNKTDDWNS